MGEVVAHVPKPASVNHGTDTKWGFSEEARAGETWAAALRASWVPVCLTLPTPLTSSSNQADPPHPPAGCKVHKTHQSSIPLVQGFGLLQPSPAAPLSLCTAGWLDPKERPCSLSSRSYRCQSLCILLSSPLRMSIETCSQSHHG